MLHIPEQSFASTHHPVWKRVEQRGNSRADPYGTAGHVYGLISQEAIIHSTVRYRSTTAPFVEPERPLYPPLSFAREQSIFVDFAFGGMIPSSSPSSLRQVQRLPKPTDACAFKLNPKTYISPGPSPTAYSLSPPHPAPASTPDPRRADLQVHGAGLLRGCGVEEPWARPVHVLASGKVACARGPNKLARN
ncbi:uncharacterized protein BO95DRAFT_73690 [Aspergillus brunneoviolaceus CBS 621.78]|uniref:Uncharacterized protein n=1 Tax=Aspergillus brunneoviolaceus CBS 621.78 TaxID=1450534 RepID=A0ACD1GEY2_9EURO|nr:hypothetical protein BO95DRAFT_73690 [Aspergillus brunneoviolaceus CBS 621.78]RAH47733.1 hypothetical protein BO95DRAFT_73690 [Aspergillus brunneoviolaceus CBS 621.78]